MARKMHFSYFLLFLILTFDPNLVKPMTLESDIQILRSLKSSIDPNSIPDTSYLGSWDFSVDPCESYGGKFLGILCTLPLENAKSRITAIDLDSSAYDGFLTTMIGNLTELTILNLSRNSFRGPIPDSITNLKKLTHLSLSQNYFTGSIPDGIGGFLSMKVLDLSHNKLSGSIPPKISGLRALTDLSLSANSFSGAIPDLDGLWQLNKLDISSNQLLGGLPKLPINLVTLILAKNILSGPISSLEKLNRLQTIDLSNNRFSGVLSERVLTLPNVIHIDVSGNRFTEIEEIMVSGRPTKLQDFDAHKNQLRGTLPANLVSIDSLRDINLSQNQFNGVIPAEYGAKLATSWTSLFLDHNFLEGDLPSEFVNGTAKIRGSLAKNCLKCPLNVTLCRGGQKSPVQCVQKKQGGSGSDF